MGPKRKKESAGPLPLPRVGRRGAVGNGCRSDDLEAGSWVGRRWERVGLIEVSQQLGQPLGIPKKEPSQHRLKSRGLSVRARRTSAAGAPSPIASSSGQITFVVVEERLELLQRLSLGCGLNLGDHGSVQIVAAPGPLTMTQPLVQFPHRIAQPGQLQRTEIAFRR